MVDDGIDGETMLETFLTHSDSPPRDPIENAILRNSLRRFDKAHVIATQVIFFLRKRVDLIGHKPKRYGIS